MKSRQYKDQIGRIIEFPYPPQRIICLVPSISELVFDLGVGNRFIGATRFCIHPKSLKKNLTVIGGTKKVHLDKINELSPDLIIANKEENDKEQIDSLAEKHPVWISDISTLADALEMINQLGDILGCTERANTIHSAISNDFNKLNSGNLPFCLYLIWKKPYMGAGKDTFIHDMLFRIGFKNVLSDRDRYPTLEINKIIELNPKLVMLSSEPYPFAQKHIEELQTYLPNAKIVLVDGELFSWYGSRLMHSVPYFENLISNISQ